MTAITRSVKVAVTPRMLQIGAEFDLPPTGESTVSWDVDLPLSEKPWSIGLIVGPSGVGKSTIARELWGNRVIKGFKWSKDQSVVDAFPAELGVRDVSRFLSSIGFNSPPSWMRPFHVLSQGEQFRVTIARALAEAAVHPERDRVVVIDEFTSVVDRQVAKVASHCVQKIVRQESMRLVAVTCHYDVVDWLQPDWIYQPDGNSFAWREVQRHPPLVFEVYRVDRTAWRAFACHHYLTSKISASATPFCAFLDGQPVAFLCYIKFYHPSAQHIAHGHRLVVLPDYQGIGLGQRFSEWLGLHLYRQGMRYREIMAHPAMVHYHRKSPRWHEDTPRQMPLAGKNAVHARRHNSARLRKTCSFEFRPAEGTV